MEGEETKSFSLSLDDYKILGGIPFQNGGHSGSMSEITLFDDDGNQVFLDQKNFFGIELNEALNK